MIEYISAVNKSLGSDQKQNLKSTQSAKNKLGRSITSKVDIKKGSILIPEMICLKSPGNGLLWREKDLILNKAAKNDILAGKTIKKNDFR